MPSRVRIPDFPLYLVLINEMSKDLVPEWQRLYREVLAQIRGIWYDIGRHEDIIQDLEERVEELEEDSAARRGG